MMKIKRILATFTAVSCMLCAAPMKVSSEPLSDEIISKTVSFYDEWKGTYVARDTYVSGDPQYYTRYRNTAYQEGGEPVPVTVSEAHGYGMLITVCMADYDSEAKEIFDGMYRFFKAHPSGIAPNLMSWQQCDNGSALVDGVFSGSDSASDGDMDIAYALLLADKQWGSGGEISYLDEAIAVINDIMKYEVNKVDWLVQLGDWVSYSKPGSKYHDAARPSDFIMQYFPVFEQATGDNRWGQVYDGTYDVIMQLTNDYDTGLLPDFITKDSSGKYVPAEPHFLEAETDGRYAYNSCRTPWRIGVDYLINKEARAKVITEKMTNWIVGETGGVASKIVAGYQLDGTPAVSYRDLCFTAPFLVAAKCEQDKNWENSVWNATVNYGSSVYYGETIKMLCMITYSDLWLVPGESDEVKGDIDNDGKFSENDIALLKNYIHGKSELSDEQISKADMDGSSKTNSIDLAIMKRMILAE